MAPEPIPESRALDTIAGLAEPNRRALYEYVSDQRSWVGREEAASAVGIRRGIAAHHLDRLAEDGLLETDYQNLSARRGPGSGRPAKVYRRAPNEIEVSFPPRRYEIAGRLMADAVDSAISDGVPIEDAISASARSEGRRLGDVARDRLEPRSTGTARRAEVVEELRRNGFEPEVLDTGVTVLHNCPFHLLAENHTALICGMNLCLVDGLLEQVEDTDLTARLEPDEQACCVRLHPGERDSESSAPQPSGGTAD